MGGLSASRPAHGMMSALHRGPGAVSLRFLPPLGGLGSRSTLHWVVHALHRGLSTAPATLGATMGGLSDSLTGGCSSYTRAQELFHQRPRLR